MSLGADLDTDIELVVQDVSALTGETVQSFVQVVAVFVECTVGDVGQAELLVICWEVALTALTANHQLSVDYITIDDYSHTCILVCTQSKVGSTAAALEC